MTQIGPLFPWIFYPTRRFSFTRWCAESYEWQNSTYRVKTWPWCVSYAWSSLVDVGLKALPDEAWYWSFAWLVLLWRLWPIKFGLEAVFGKAWLTLVWRVCAIRPDWRKCEGPAWWGLVGIDMQPFPNKASMKTLPNEAWLALVYKFCSMRPGWHWCQSFAQWGLV